MSTRSPLVFLAFLVSMLAAPAVADTTISLRNGNTVTGALEPADEVEVLTVTVPAGAVLKIKAKGAKGGPAVSIRITDDLDAPVGVDSIKEKRTGVSGKLRLEHGGIYRIEVFSRDGETAGGYALKVQWKSLKKYKLAPPADVDGGTVSFRADRGALISASLSAGKKSDVVPRITRITGPRDFEWFVDPPTKAARDTFKGVGVDYTGDYTLHYVNDGAVGGAVKAKIVVKQPKPAKETFDVSADPTGGGGDSTVGTVALAGEETSVSIGLSDDPDNPLNEIAGSGLVIPAGALSESTVILIGTSASIDAPVGEGPSRSIGPGVSFGPDGQQFNQPVQVTITADVTAGQSDVVVLQSSADGTLETLTDVTVENGSVITAASHFSDFQVHSQTRLPPTEVKHLAANAAAGDRFGWRVEIDGDRAVIAAREKDAPTNNEGSLYIFERDGAGAWNEVTELFASDGAANDRLGDDVSISGDTVVAGTSSHNSLRGAVYVFARDSGGVWSEQAKITAADASVGDQLGISVDIEGDSLIAGAYANDAGVAFSLAGAAYVSTRDGAGVWTLQDKLVASDGGFRHAFGRSVAISGDTAVVGATQHDDGPGDGNGAAYVFTRDGAGAWTEQAKLTASDAAISDAFGSWVDIDGDTVVVGASADDDGGPSSGSAYVFTRNGAGVWTEQAKLTASDAQQFEFFGVVLSLEADTVVVGATHSPIGAPFGAAFVFERDGAGVWTEYAKLTASDGLFNDFFGQGLGISGDQVIVGSRSDDGDGSNSGSVYVIDLNPGEYDDE